MGLNLEKQIVFAAAQALTDTAKAGQALARKNLRDTFTVRNQWPERGPLAVKIKPATKATLSASIDTAADFLVVQEKGGTKYPLGQFLAVPTSNVRRTPKGLIKKLDRPRNIKNSFVTVTKKNRIPIIFRRNSKQRSDVTALYVLVPRAKIDRAATIVPAAEQAVHDNFALAFSRRLRAAIASARAEK
jgi:hypothetical protein